MYSSPEVCKEGRQVDVVEGEVGKAVDQEQDEDD